MKSYAFVDLHIHTVHSYEDGVDITVQKLLDMLNAMAEKENKNICFSITDHESILGCIEAAKLLKCRPDEYKRLHFIPGIELNASLKSVGLNESGHSIYSRCHMLGYGYNLMDRNLITYSKLSHKKVFADVSTKKGVIRKQINTGKQIICAKKYLETLFKTKIPFNIYEQCANLDSHNEIRKNFILVSSIFLNLTENEVEEIIKNIYYAEPKYNEIADGSSKQDIFDIINMIKSAGGKVGIAHGNTIKFEQKEIFADKTNPNIKMEMFDRFIDIVQKASNNGLDFVELFHNENTVPRAFDKMYEIAKKYNLFVTCGSDFHGGVLHPNNMLSKCFSKRFEYCSLDIDDREDYKNKIKNKITGLAFVDYMLNKSNAMELESKQSFKCENILKGELNLVEIKNIINLIDDMDMKEFNKFYDIKKQSKTFKEKENTPKSTNFDFSSLDNFENIDVENDYYEDMHEVYYKQKNNKKSSGKYSKKSSIKNTTKKKSCKNKNKKNLNKEKYCDFFEF